METTRELDGTGLYYYRARYYHPTLSRFISEDPIEYAAGANIYAYVGGNPVSFGDPDGLQRGPLPGGGYSYPIPKGQYRNGGTPPTTYQPELTTRERVENINRGLADLPPYNPGGLINMREVLSPNPVHGCICGPRSAPVSECTRSNDGSRPVSVKGPVMTNPGSNACRCF